MRRRSGRPEPAVADAATAVVSGVIVGAGYVIPIAILALLAVLVGRLAAPWAAPLAARRRSPAATPPDD